MDIRRVSEAHIKGQTYVILQHPAITWPIFATGPTTCESQTVAAEIIRCTELSEELMSERLSD